MARDGLTLWQLSFRSSLCFCSNEAKIIILRCKLYNTNQATIMDD